MFNKIPIELIKTTSEVEPALMKGSGNPVGGMEPDTTAIFKKVWTQIIAVIPEAK